MMRMGRAPVCGAMLVCLANAAAPGGTLIVDVHNVRAAKGQVRIDVCPQAQFLTDHCPWHGNAPARIGTTSVTITGVPAGDYAVQAYLDENNNSKVDQGLFGIPREGIGFSNDARIGLGPPRWRAAVFGFDGVAATLRVKLRYFLGRSGPEQ